MIMEEFSQILLKNSPDPIWIANPDYSIRYVNPALEKLTGFSASELVGSTPPYPFWAEEYRKQNQRWLFSRQKRLTKSEFLHKTKCGDRFWVEITSIPVIDTGKLLYYLSIWTDITEAKKLRENVQFYIAQITKAQEEERTRIACELHDETAQELATLCLEIGEILAMENQPRIAFDLLKKVPHTIELIIDELRCLCQKIRPSMLAKFGFVRALKSIVKHINAQRDLTCSVKVFGREKRLPVDMEIMIFRIVQEALQNVNKHAEATEGRIVVKFCESVVKVHISDNGKGFKVPRNVSDFVRTGKLGLMGMEERVNLLKGKIKVQSRLNIGTDITVEIPIDDTICCQSAERDSFSTEHL